MPQTLQWLSNARKYHKHLYTNGPYSLCTAFYGGCDVTLSTFAAVVLLLLTAGRPPLLIDISCPWGTQQQTRCMPLLLPIDGTDRQTDTRPLHRPCSEYYANSANKSNVNYQLPAATRKQHHQSYVQQCLF